MDSNGVSRKGRLQMYASDALLLTRKPLIALADTPAIRDWRQHWTRANIWEESGGMELSNTLRILQQV